MNFRRNMIGLWLAFGFATLLLSCSDGQQTDKPKQEYELLAHHYEEESRDIAAKTETKDEVDMEKTVYQFEANDINGNPISLDAYKGKVLLIVNTASECGFTPQYEGLQALYKEYKEKGLEILAFPCNQFGGQEPGGSSEIASFCEANFGVTFPIFEKVDVNGDNEHELFTFLKSEKSGLLTDAVKWNFTKFLIDRNGKPVDRFAPQTKPSDLNDDIEKLL